MSWFRKKGPSVKQEVAEGCLDAAQKNLDELMDFLRETRDRREQALLEQALGKRGRD